jgi:hypothetical protein
MIAKRGRFLQIGGNSKRQRLRDATFREQMSSSLIA